MEFLLMLALGGAVVYLWRRLDRIEMRLAQFDEGQPPAIGKQAAVPATPIEPAEPGTKPAEVAPVPPVPAMQPVPAGPERTIPLEEREAPAPEAAEVDPWEDKPRERNWQLGFRFDFEEIFGRLLPIWAGGVALAVAGFFFVRYSIEQGLLTEPVRVGLSFLFGAGLLGAAEIAYRQEHRITDERVRQALAGAGLATLYAGFYLAGTLYGLIGSGIAFLGLAGVTTGAITLSHRFGLPSAILGLVGGFAAPLMVESADPNIPLLTLYLGLVTAGLIFTGRRQDRAWLALAALGGGLGWGVMLLVSGTAGLGDTLAIGLYLVALGTFLPAFISSGKTHRFVRIGAAAIASLQMAALVHQGGYEPLAWGLYALLGAALAWFGWRIERTREASLVVAAVGRWMLGFWPEPSPAAFAAVAAVMTAIFAGVSLAHHWRDEARIADTIQLCAFPLGLIGMAYWRFGVAGGDTIDPLLALAALALSALPALAAWLAWPRANAGLSRAQLACLASSFAGAFAAFLMATAGWAAPLGGALLAAIAFLLMRLRSDYGLVQIGWSVAMTGAILLLFLPWVEPRVADETWQLVRETGPADWLGSLRWAAAAMAFVPLILREPSRLLRGMAEALTAIFVYGAVAQILPGQALAWFAGLSAALLVWFLPVRRAATVTMLALTGLWSLTVMLEWSVSGIGALGAEPFLSGDMATWDDALVYLLPLVMGLGVLLWRRTDRHGPWHKRIAAGFAALALVFLHHFYKPLFAIDDLDRFVEFGLAERTVWQGLLLGEAVVAWLALRRFEWHRILAAVLASAALVHSLLFTMLLHNPLWDTQAVGPWPLANWLLPAYAIAIGGTLLLARLMDGASPALRLAADIALMVLVAAFTLSELRQVFAGSVLTAEPVGQVEDLLRSVLGIALALAYLWWGSRTNTRSWRIGSLVLMLIAVLKVFLFDAAGLEGLARIASFMALGFSLIGIGWFYTRQLKARPVLEE